VNEGLADMRQGGTIMKRSGSAVWQGDLKNGNGTVSTDSGVLANQQYSFGTRFENGKGTNPEELIAAAHAGCFTMALSAQLGNAGLTAEKLATTATVTFDKLEAGWTVTHILLDVKGRVPKADQAAWDKATQAAKTGCPISRLLNTTIEMKATLEG
jgi:lipoyl-dependent peroxiredoxin